MPNNVATHYGDVKGGVACERSQTDCIGYRDYNSPNKITQGVDVIHVPLGFEHLADTSTISVPIPLSNNASAPMISNAMKPQIQLPRSVVWCGVV